MAIVTNKADILGKLNLYYNVFADTNGLSDRQVFINTPIKVPKLMVFSSKYTMSVGGAYVDDFDDKNEDYALNYEMAMVVGNELLSDFYIAPTNAHLEHDSEYGLMLEWIPKRPLYMETFHKYMKLYQSFVKYLESTPKGGYFEDVKFKICFSALYHNMQKDDVITGYINRATEKKGKFISKFLF